MLNDTYTCLFSLPGWKLVLNKAMKSSLPRSPSRANTPGTGRSSSLATAPMSTHQLGIPAPSDGNSAPWDGLQDLPPALGARQGTNTPPVSQCLRARVPEPSSIQVPMEFAALVSSPVLPYPRASTASSPGTLIPLHSHPCATLIPLCSQPLGTHIWCPDPTSPGIFSPRYPHFVAPFLPPFRSPHL